MLLNYIFLSTHNINSFGKIFHCISLFHLSAHATTIYSVHINKCFIGGFVCNHARRSRLNIKCNGCLRVTDKVTTKARTGGIIEDGTILCLSILYLYIALSCKCNSPLCRFGIGIIGLVQRIFRSGISQVLLIYGIVEGVCAFCSTQRKGVRFACSTRFGGNGVIFDCNSS